MEIKIRLYKSVIIKAVKDETYLSGRAILLEDGSNSEKVYNIQAGDDETHEAKLLRSLRVGLDDLKIQLSNFAKNDGSETGDSITDTMNDKYDYFDISLKVSTRFNNGYVDLLASMCSSYITDYTIATWWTAVSPELATSYYSSAAATLVNIRHCFIKMPPKAPVSKYAKEIVAEVEYEDGNELKIGIPYPASYSLVPQDEANGKVIDDVMIKSSDSTFIKVGGTVGNYTLTRMKKYGLSDVTLYSEHNPDVCTGWIIEAWMEDN